MKIKSIVLTLACAFLAAQAPSPAPDPWAPVKGLAGDWTGKCEGEPGSGTAQRSYRFVLEGRYLQERNVSTYLARQAGKPGEVHEHMSMLSYDKLRKRLVLRQFHPEGFVNQYVLDESASGPRRLVFVSEAFENLDPRWKARETYELSAPDRFTETFEIAPPGKDFSVYSRTEFTRVPKP